LLAVTSDSRATFTPAIDTMMRKRHLRATRLLAGDDRGQSLVEFALLVPLFLFLLIGIFEFGRAWNIYQVVVNAAREGGRVAALPIGFADEDSVSSRVDTYLSSAGLDSGTATVDMEDVNGAPGTIATVGVSYPYSFTFIGPLASLFSSSSSLGGTIMLSSTINMRNE
jgi:Flp pilus assembly protein TadG